jgi:hypothetical protein
MRVRFGWLKHGAKKVIIFALFLSTAAFGREAAELSIVTVHPARTHYVAPNGDDNGPGSKDRPWATINHAAEQARPGETIMIAGGRYILRAQIRVKNSGTAAAWITFVGMPGRASVLDAEKIPHSDLFSSGLDNGAFQIENVNYVRVINLTVVRSHDAAFTIRDASYVDLINNKSTWSYSSGIAVWDTDHQGHATRHIRILGNAVRHANVGPISPGHEAPHEAISVGGAIHFEVAYNRVEDCAKEGIDIKETSKTGTVHHNIVNGVARQAIYLDSWFGELSKVEIYSNVLYNDMAGIVLSVENGERVRDVRIDRNVIFSNAGSGLYFSRWSRDGEREAIKIYDNIFYENGCATPKKGQEYFWMTGGVYLYSSKISEIAISNNRFTKNCGFQIGYSELYLQEYKSWDDAAKAKQILISGNIIDGPNATHNPIESGGDLPDQIKIYAVDGLDALRQRAASEEPSSPRFDQDSRVSSGMTYLARIERGRAWLKHFPPTLFAVRPARAP